MPDHYDVVVVGGGIHGAGVAQAAAAAGYSVLVLEQTGIASGTSSRSSKLIHGGLRYLESAQFNLVRECLFERALLLKNAPDLVQLKPFYIPIYPDTTRNPWTIRGGLALYSTLGGLGEATRFKQVHHRDWDKLDGLDREALRKVFRYYDAQTDDALLTKAVIRSAQSLGAELIMPGRLVSAAKISSGYTIRYLDNNIAKEVTSTLLVNAAGPWVNQVLDMIETKPLKLEVDLIQGTHIILEGTVTQGIYYVEAPEDQRAVFIMPWYDKLMVGTTESFFHGNPAKVIPLAQEKQYLLQTLGYYFPKYRFATHKDIVKSFAGLRVLPRATGDAFLRPRDTILHGDDLTNAHLVTIYGGKLTAYRATAERLINEFGHVLPHRRAKADTRQLHLSAE